MLRFEDDKTSIAEAPACWAKLTDLRFLTQCIPNIESVVESRPDQVRFKLRPGVSFVRGSLDVTFTIDQLEPGKSARYSIHSQGIGSSSDVEALLTLDEVRNVECGVRNQEGVSGSGIPHSALDIPQSEIPHSKFRTHLHWTVDIKSLGGLLKALPQGLIKASAQKVIGDIWSAVEKKLQPAPPNQTTGP